MSASNWGLLLTAETLDEVKVILKDLVLLQLNGVEEVDDIYRYLVENGVLVMKPEVSRGASSNFTLTTAGVAGV